LGIEIRNPKSKIRNWAGLLAASLAAALGFLACTPEERHRVLVFFFDGVPPLHPGQEGVEVPVASKAGTPGEQPIARPLAPAVRLYEHKPGTDEKQCKVCHDAQRAFSLTMPVNDLCAKCHKREVQAAKHGPTAFGDCVACHEVHRSPYKYLVKLPGPKLCFHCHEREPIAGNGRPPGAEPTSCPRASDDANCLSCHDPHGGGLRASSSGRAAEADGKAGGATPQPPKEAP